MEEFQGKVWKLRDDIGIGIILSTEYLAFPTITEMKPCVFSSLRPELVGKIEPGDITADSENFSYGSSREQAPGVVKAFGIRAVIAKSFTHISFRNAVSNGPLLIECHDPPDEVNEGDTLAATVGEKIRVNGEDHKTATLPENLTETLNAGGLAKAMWKRNGLN